MAKTTPRQFRFTDDDLALMDRIAATLAPDLDARVTRTAVLRLALHELAERRLPKGPKKKSPKSEKKGE